MRHFKGRRSLGSILSFMFVFLLFIILCSLGTPSPFLIPAEGVLTFSTGSITDASLYQSVTFTVVSNPLLNDPVISTADKLFLVLNTESSTACTTTNTDAETFSITTVNTGGYSGTAAVPITPSIVSVGQRYVVCYLSSSTSSAIVVQRGFITGSTELTLLIWPALYSQYQLSPTTASPSLGSGPVGLAVPQVTYSERPINQALTGSYTMLLISCPSATLCEEGASASLVERCATMGSAYMNAINSGSAYDSDGIIPLSSLRGQSTGTTSGSFVVPFSASTAGYMVCVPYCATASCNSASPTYTLVASDGNPSLSIAFTSPNPSVYTRTPQSPQAREEGTITFTGTDLSAEDEVQILEPSQSCASSSSSVLSSVAVGSLQLVSTTSSTVSFIAPDLLSAQVIGLVCYYRKTIQLWTPVYLSPSTNPKADFTIDVLQPHSFVVVPSSPMLGASIAVTFSGTGLSSSADTAFLTTSTENDPCTTTTSTSSIYVFTCIMSSGVAGSETTPVCTLILNTDSNDALDLSICYKKSGISNYALLDGVISVSARAPTYTVTSNPVYAGQTVSLQFSGTTLSSYDRVQLVSSGTSCETGTPSNAVDILSTTTLGQYQLVGQANLCLRVCYYLASSATWIISGPNSGATDSSSSCDTNNLFISLFPLRYQLATSVTSTNGGVGLVVAQTTTVVLTMDSSASVVSTEGLTPVLAKVIKTPDTCVTTFCSNAAACAQSADPADYVSKVYGSTQQTLTLLVNTAASNYVLCVQVAGLEDMYIPVLPITATGASDLSFGFTAAAANPTLTQLRPQTWRAWMSSYSASFSGSNLNSDADMVYLFASSSMISTSTASTTSTAVVCPLPQSTGSLSTVLTSSVSAGSSSASTVASFSSGQSLYSGEQLFLCYVWTAGTQQRMTYAGSVLVEASVPSSYTWGLQPSSGYRAGTPFTLTVNSNTSAALSPVNDIIYFYRYSSKLTAQSCFCSVSTCSSGTLVNYLKSDPEETKLSALSSSSLLLSRAVGFDNYGYMAYYVTCYSPYGVGVDTYLGVVSVKMADPLYYLTSLADGSSPRVGAALTITAYACTSPSCTALTVSDSLLLAPSSMSCSEVEDLTSVNDYVKVVGQATVGSGGVTFSQVIVPLKVGDYRVCFRSVDSSASQQYSELVYSKSYIRQYITVQSSNPSAFTPFPTSPTAGQFLTLSLACSGTRCSKCQTLRLLSGASASCWDSTIVSTYNSSSCLSETTAYQFPNVFLPSGTYIVCFNDTNVWTSARQIPGTLVVSAANPSAYSPALADDNTIVTDQSTPYYINITGTSLSSSSDEVFLLTSKGYTCHDLRNSDIYKGVLAKWFAPSVNPYPLLLSTTGVDWLVSDQSKRFGAGLLLNTTLCPGDNADCAMQLCYKRQSGSWAPVALAASQKEPIYLIASNPHKAEFDQYPLIVNMYTMVTVYGTGLTSTDTVTLFATGCDSGTPLSTSVSGLTPVVSADGTSWKGVIRITGTSNPVAVCYNRIDSTEVTEIVVVELFPSGGSTSSDTIFPIQWPPLYYILNSNNFTDMGIGYMLTMYEELQVQATFAAGGAVLSPLLSGALIESLEECNYPPFNTETGSSAVLPVVSSLELLSGTSSSSAVYQARLYLPGGIEDSYAMCLHTSAGYFRVTQLAPASSDTSTVPTAAITFADASPATYSVSPSYATIGQTLTFTFISSGSSSTTSDTVGHLGAGDTVNLIDGTLFECGFHNSTRTIAEATAAAGTPTTTSTSTTAEFVIPYDHSLVQAKLTLCYRKIDGTFATVPLKGTVDRNFILAQLNPASWVSSPTQATIEQPLSITFHPPTSLTSADVPLSASDVAYLVELSEGETSSSLTGEQGNTLCLEGQEAVTSKGTLLTYDATEHTTLWDISAMPSNEKTYVVCYIAQANGFPIYVDDPAVLTLYPHQSPTGVYTNRGIEDIVFQGERFYLYFNTTVELNVKLESEVTTSASTIDIVRISGTIDCSRSAVATAFQSIPTSFGYKTLTDVNSDGILIPYLHLRVRADVGKYYVCMKRAQRESWEMYYDYSVVGGRNFPSIITVTEAPITAFSTSPTSPRAWVPSTSVTPTYGSQDYSASAFAQLFFVPFKGDASIIETTSELAYDDCYRPASVDEASSTSVTLVSTTLQVNLPGLVAAYPFPTATKYLLCYQVKEQATNTDLFIASVYPSIVTISNPSPTAYLVPDVLTVQRSFVMGFTAVDSIFTSTSNNQAHIYVAPSTPNPEDTTAPSCEDGVVPSDSESSFTSFTLTNSTYASVQPLLATENYYYVCFLTSGQDHMFPVPNYNGGYYFSVGIHGPQSYSIQPQKPFLGATSAITITGSLLSTEDHVKVVFADSSVDPSDYKDLCTAAALNADVTSTSASGVSVDPEAGALAALYYPRLNATGTFVLCYQSKLLDNQWLYVSPLTSFDVQDAHPSSYLQDPVPSYATAVNTLIIRDSSGLLGTSTSALKLVQRGSGGDSGFDCTDSTSQSRFIVLVSYKPDESSTSSASFAICGTSAVTLTVCYKLDVANTGWAEVPLQSPPPHYTFQGATIAANPFPNAPVVSPTSPRPYSTFTMKLTSTDSDANAYYVSFARSPQSLCELNVPFVPPLYYEKSQSATNTFTISLPYPGAYVVYVGVTSDVLGPNVTLTQTLVVGSCDPCTFSPPYAMVTNTVSLLFPSASGASLSSSDELRLIPISQGLEGQPCEEPTGPYKTSTFMPSSTGTGGSSTTFTISTGTAAEETSYEGSYYACYRRSGDDDYAIVSNSAGSPKVFSILPNNIGVVVAESCPESGSIYALETVTYNLTSSDTEKYPQVQFSDKDEMVLLQPAALPATGCQGIDISLAELHSTYPQAVVIPTMESFSETQSNWFATMQNSIATSYTPCFRLAYTDTFYSVVSSPELVLAANPSTYAAYPPVVLPTTASFLLTISGSGLLSTDEVFLVSTAEGNCIETCYLVAHPKDWSGVSIERVSVATQQLELKVTNLMSTTSESAVVLRVCYRRTNHYLTELGQIYIGEQNPSAYTVNFVPRVGTQPTLTFTGKHLTSADRVYLVRKDDYCVTDNALVFGSFLSIDETSGSNAPTWTSFLVPLHVSIGFYRVCYVLSTINAGVPVGDALEVLAGGPSAFATSNTPMKGRATVVSFPATSTSAYEAQAGDEAYIACVGCSCFNQKEAVVEYGNTRAVYSSTSGTISMRVGFGTTDVYPVCYKVNDSGYALVSNLTPQENSPTTVAVYPLPTYQGQRLQYTFSSFSEAAPGVLTDEAMLVSQQRQCWETPAISGADIIISPSVISSLVNGVVDWDSHVPSVGPNTPSSALFPLAYTLCYQQSGQSEYVAVPYPFSTSSWMQAPNPSTYTTTPSLVRGGMMGVVVTFPQAEEGDEVYLVAYNSKSDTVCTDTDTVILSAQGVAYPTYKMNISGGTPTGTEAGVFCYIRKDATVAEVPQLLAIYDGNPSGYTTNATSGFPTRFREYIAFNVSGTTLTETDRVVFTIESCAQAIAALETTASTSTTSSTTSTTVSSEVLESTPFLSRCSDFAYASNGNSMTFVAQFMNTEDDRTTSTSVHLCYSHDGVWTEVGSAIPLNEPEPLSATLTHASVGSISNIPLRVNQYLQIQLNGASSSSVLQAAVISSEDSDPNSWCSNFTSVQEPGLVITNAALLHIPVWEVAGVSRLCLLGSDKPWADAGSTIYTPGLAEVFPANPASMAVFPAVPRVGQKVTLTFHLIVQSSSTDAVKIIEDKGSETEPCETAESIDGLKESFATVVEDYITTYTPLDSTDPLGYRSFHTSGNYLVCYYSSKEEVWSVVWVGSEEDQKELKKLHIYPLAPESWKVRSGSLVMGQSFQLEFHEDSEEDVLHPDVDLVWAVPSGLNCDTTPAECSTCLNFTIDTESSGSASVITLAIGTTVVDTFYICYQLQNASPAVIPDALIIANASVKCSITQQVIIGEQQTVVFEKDDGVSVDDDTWRVSFYAVDAVLGCEERYVPDFVAARATQSSITSTSVSYTLEWPVTLTDSQYVICYDHDNVIGPVCTCAQLAAKDGSCYLEALIGSPASFSVVPYPTYVGQYVTLTFSLDATLTGYPPTDVKFVVDEDMYLTTCQGDAAFTPTNAVLTKVTDTSYTYSFQHDYKLGSSRLIVCALTARSSEYSRVGTTEEEGAVLYIRPYMQLSTVPSESKFIRAMQTISLNLSHTSHYADDVVSSKDEIYLVEDPYKCTSTYIDAQNPVDAMQVIEVDDSAFDSLPADVASINSATKSSFSYVTFGSTAGSTYYVCYKLSNGGTWAPVLPLLDLLSAAVNTCSMKDATSTENSASSSYRAMQYIATTLIGGDTLSGLANPSTDAIRVVSQNQPCISESTSLFESTVVAASTAGSYTTVAFSPSAGTYKVCYRFGSASSKETNWSPVCQNVILVAPTPTGTTVGCFAVRQALEVNASQRTDYVFTTSDTFRFIPGNQPCLTPSLTAVSPSSTITVGDAAQTTAGVSPSTGDTSLFEVPYALLGTGTSSVKLCYTDHEGNEFAVPLQYASQPLVSSWNVQGKQPLDLLAQLKMEVGQRIMMNFTSSGSTTLSLTPYAVLPSPFTDAPAFDGSFDGSALLGLGSGSVYRDGRCIAAEKAAASSNLNVLGLLGVYGPASTKYTISGFAPTTAQTYITCYRLAKCLVADVGATLAVQPTNPEDSTTLPSLPRRGQLITVNFANNAASVDGLTPGKDRGTKQADLDSCWELPLTAGSVVEGTSTETYFVVFFPSQSPAKASTTTTRTCYLLVGGSWSNIPNGVGDVLPANPTGFNTVPSAPRVDQLLELEVSGEGLAAGDQLKIAAGVLLNCSDDIISSSDIQFYDTDGNVVSADTTTGFEVKKVSSDRKLATILFSGSSTATYSICYRLVSDEVWTLVYGTLVLLDRSPVTVTMTPVSVLETELFTLQFASAVDSSSGSGTLLATDRVVLYAGETTSCLNPGDAVSIHAAPSNTDNLPLVIDFQLDMGTRGTYTICYLSTTYAGSAVEEPTRTPIWGFPTVTAKPDPVALQVFPQLEGTEGSLSGLRENEIISLVFTGFGLVADSSTGKTDEVKLISASVYSTPTDELCRTAPSVADVTFLPLYANGTHAVQVFSSSVSSATTSTEGQYWICYRLNGGQFHYIGDEVFVSQLAQPGTATTTKALPTSSTYSYFDGETIPWTLTINSLCSSANSNFLFYSSNSCGDVKYFTGVISTTAEASKYFPMGYAPVTCGSSSPTYVRIASGSVFQEVFGDSPSSPMKLSLCYYYGAKASTSTTVSTTLPSVTVLGEPNRIPVQYGVPPVLSSTLKVVAMAPFSFTLSVVPGSNDYLSLVKEKEECVGVSSPDDASLFLTSSVSQANGEIVVTSAVPSAGTYYICYSNRVGLCSSADWDCARVVGEIYAAAPSPSSWTGTPSTVYTTDSYSVTFHYPSEAAAAEGPEGMAWIMAVDGDSPSMLNVYQACKSTLLPTSTTTTTSAASTSTIASSRGERAIDLKYNSSTLQWVSESPFTVEGLHALCYTDATGTSSLHLFGPVNYAGPVVLPSQVESAQWTSVPVLVSVNSAVVLHGGGLASTDQLIAVSYSTETIPSDICTDTSYTPRVSADELTSDDSGQASITRTMTFLSSGSYVLCYRSSSWSETRSAEIISSLGSFSVLPSVVSVSVKGERQYVGVPLTLLFTGSGLLSSDAAALVYVDPSSTLTDEICSTTLAKYESLENVATSGDQASLTTTPNTPGLHAICFKGVSSSGETETILLPTTLMVYTITAVNAVFSVQPACDASRVCQSQPSVELRDSSGTPASTPDSTIALWLVNSDGDTVTVEAGLAGGSMYFFNDKYTTFDFVSVILYKAGTYRMKANVTLPDGVVLIATSSLFEAKENSEGYSIAELTCSPVGIVQSVSETVSCVVTALTTSYPSSYEVTVQPGSSTSCNPMDTPSETGLPRCQFTVSPPSSITTNYIAISVSPGDPYSSWPVKNSPTVIRLPRTPDASSSLACSTPVYDPALPSSNLVRAGDSLTCAAQGIAVVNGVSQSIVALPDELSIRHFINDQSGSVEVVDLGTYPEGLNGLYTATIAVSSAAAHKITITGQVRQSSNLWTAMQGSPEVFTVLGTPTASATTFVCVSNVTGSKTYLSPSNNMNCTLDLANAAGSVLGLLQDFTVSMPNGGTVGTLPVTATPTDTLSWFLKSPSQPSTALQSATFEFAVNVFFEPMNNNQVASNSFGLVYVTTVVTSPLPELTIGERVALTLEGSGLVLTHHYSVASRASGCSSSQASTPAAAFSVSDDQLKLEFVVPNAASFYLCYCPSDGSTYQELFPQSFLTSKSSNVVWTKANIILLALGVAFLAILLVLLVILICRICCVRQHTEKAIRNSPEGYVPPRLNDRYIHQVTANPVAPALPPAPPVQRSVTQHITKEDEADVTRVNIHLQDHPSGPPPPTLNTGRGPSRAPLLPQNGMKTETESTLMDSSSVLSGTGRNHRRRRSGLPSAPVQAQEVPPPLPLFPVPGGAQTPPAALPALSDALLDPHRRPSRRHSKGSRVSRRGSAGNHNNSAEPWSPREPSVPKDNIPLTIELPSSHTPPSLVAQETVPAFAASTAPPVSSNDQVLPRNSSQPPASLQGGTSLLVPAVGVRPVIPIPQGQSESIERNTLYPSAVSGVGHTTKPMVRSRSASHTSRAPSSA